MKSKEQRRQKLERQNSCQLTDLSQSHVASNVTANETFTFIVIIIIAVGLIKIPQEYN